MWYKRTRYIQVTLKALARLRVVIRFVTFYTPDALHSSSKFMMLCSGALIDGRISRLEGGRDLVVGVSDSVGGDSCIAGRSAFLWTLEDTRSFHILPSWSSEKIKNRRLFYLNLLNKVKAWGYVKFKPKVMEPQTPIKSAVSKFFTPNCIG